METDQISVSSKGVAGPYILLARIFANDLWAWLASAEQRVSCSIPTDVFVDNEPYDAVIEIDMSPEEIEPLIDKWFELLKITPQKYCDSDRVTWEFGRDEYGKAVRLLRKGLLKR